MIIFGSFLEYLLAILSSPLYRDFELYLATTMLQIQLSNKKIRQKILRFVHLVLKPHPSKPNNELVDWNNLIFTHFKEEGNLLCFV